MCSRTTGLGTTGLADCLRRWQSTGTFNGTASPANTQRLVEDLAMRKRVGNIEIHSNIDSTWTKVIYHCNDSVHDEIQMRSREDIVDLQYALSAALREMDNWAQTRS